MAKSETTSKLAAKAASKTLKSSDSGNHSKSSAASALSQHKAPSKETGSEAASSASKTLSDGRTASASKALLVVPDSEKEEEELAWRHHGLRLDRESRALANERTI